MPEPFTHVSDARPRKIIRQAAVIRFFFGQCYSGKAMPEYFWQAASS